MRNYKNGVMMGCLCECILLSYGDLLRWAAKFPWNDVPEHRLPEHRKLNYMPVPETTMANFGDNNLASQISNLKRSTVS